MYGIVMKCNKGCEHLVSVGKTYMDAWGNVPLNLIGLTAEPDICRTVRLKRQDVEKMKFLVKNTKDIDRYPNIGGLEV